jgi:fibronectin type 3 domain-containing protein
MFAVHVGPSRAFLILVAIGCAGHDRTVGVDQDSAGTAVRASTLAAPSALSAAAAAASRIDLVWQDESGRETGFEIFRSTSGAAGTFTLLATTGANSMAHADEGLTSLRQYCYRVRAFEVRGTKRTHSNFSGTVACATTSGSPPAPSNINAWADNSTTARMQWIDRSATEDGFRVQRSAASTGPWEVIAAIAANTTAHVDAGRTSDQQACYRVVAFNAHGESEPSNTDCVTLVSAPTNLSASTATRGIDLAWIDNSAVEDGFEIERSTDGQSFQHLAQLPSNSTRYSDSGGIGTGTTYSYRLRAFRYGDGFSDHSSVASAQGDANPIQLVATAVYSPDMREAAIDLAWGGMPTGDEYQLWRYDPWTEETYIIAILAANVTTYHDAVGWDGAFSYQLLTMRDGAVVGHSNWASAWTGYPPWMASRQPSRPRTLPPPP